MQALARVAIWTLSMVGLSVIQAANGTAGFLGQEVTMPLWALLLFILLPGEAFADVARTAVERFGGRISDGED